MKYKTLMFFYIVILGLIPLLWFKGSFITGTDVNFSPFPSDKFMVRFYTWDSRISAGAERGINISSLSYIATPFLIDKFTSNIITGEKLTYVIWFTLTGFSMAYLLEKIFADKSQKERFLIKIFGILIYMINFYHVFLWLRLQVTITSLVFLPVLIGVFYEVLDKNILKKKDLLILAIATILGGPLGKQPPIMYAIIVAMIVLIGLYLLFDLAAKRFEVFWKKIKKLLLGTLVVFLCGAYWIFPLGNYIFRSGLIQGAETGTSVYEVEKLLEWTSKITSNLNILRSFGDVVWFDEWGGELYFPEFVEFYNNPIYVVISFLVLFAIFFSFYKNKENKKSIVVFGLIALVGLYFSKGIHPPFNGLFIWSFKNLPGFWIHRAPWQKFGIVVTLAYGVLGGYGAYQLLKVLNEKFKVKKALIALVFVGLYLALNSIFVFGKMFHSKESDEGYHGAFNLGFHITFPDYLYDLREYALSFKEKYYNTLLLPEQNTNVYDWGYGGSIDIVSIFTTRTTLFAPYGEGSGIDSFIGDVYNAIVSALYNNNVAGLSKVFDFYNIKYILQRNDFRHDFYGDTDSPVFIKEKLSNLNLEEPQVFGKWDLYDTGSQNYDLIYSANNVIDVSEMSTNILLPVMQGDNSGMVLINDPEGLPISQTYASSSADYVESKVIKEEKIPDPVFPEVNVSPESVLYKLVRFKEKRVEDKTKDLEQRAEVILWHATKRISEILNYSKISLEKKQDLISDYIEGLRDYNLMVFEVEDVDTKASLAFKGIKNIYMVIESLEDLSEPVGATNLIRENLVELEQLSDGILERTCFGYCYTFDIENEGSYEVLLYEPDYGSVMRGNYRVGLRDSKYNSVPPISSNVFFLSKGKHVVSLEGPRSQPLPYNKGVRINPKRIETELEPDQSVVYLGIPNLTAVSKLTFQVDDSTKDYMVSFNAGEAEAVGMTVIEVSGEKRITKLAELIETSVIKDKPFVKSFTSTSNPDFFELYIISYDNEGTDLNGVRNLLFSKRLDPNIIFKSDFQSNDEFARPDLTFERLNPTKYLVRLEKVCCDKPFMLVMNQTFSKHWKVYVGKEERNNFLRGFETLFLKEISKEDHYKSNYFGNSWKISPEDIKDAKYLIIEFSSQVMFYVSSIFTAVTIIVLVYLYKRKKK